MTWLAAAPIVVWGAPFGSWVASVMSSRQLVMFVATTAVLEVATMMIFLDALHNDLTLMIFGIVGTCIALLGVNALVRSREWITRRPGGSVPHS